MAMNQQQRDERRHAKAARVKEEDLRLKVRPGTKQALAELMQWAGIEEQGEALTLMIHHLHGLGPKGSAPFLTAPRHVFSIKQNVAQLFDQRSMQMIQKDPGDEVICPPCDRQPPWLGKSHDLWPRSINSRANRDPPSKAGRQFLSGQRFRFHA